MNIFFLILILTSIINANILTKVDSDNINITIYNSNLAFINEKRTAQVLKGFNNIVYKNVAQSVIEESISPTFTNIDTILYSQNYVYNTITMDSLLKYSINKDVNYFSNNNKKELKQGKLLSYSPNAIIQDSKINKIFTVNARDIVFNKIPKNMITQPSLMWRLEAKEEGKLNIDLKYLTRNISWSSNYIINLKKNILDIVGLITINNNSGITYNNANITCLAGEVSHSQKRYRRRISKKRVFASSQSSFKRKPIVDESFSGYHIYKIPFKETIKNKEKKQIVFIDTKNIKYKNWAEYKDSFGMTANQVKLKFKNIIEFKNSKINNLGITLPKGKLRLYKNDLSGKSHFIGEDTINNSPKDETIKLSIGNFFDIVGERVTTRDLPLNKYYFKNSYNIRNQGKEEVTIKVIETYSKKIKSYKNWSINNCNQDKMTKNKINAFTVEIKIKLKPKEQYSFITEKM